MKIKHHYLTEKQIKFIARLAKKEKVSEAEIVRHALDYYKKYLEEINMLEEMAVRSS